MKNFKLLCLLFTFITALLLMNTCFAQEYPPRHGPLRNGPMGPPQDGPFNDQVFGAVSKNGFDFEVLPGPFFKHASVPDVLELTSDCKAGDNGELLLYFVDFSDVMGPGSEGVSVAFSSNGLDWSDKEVVTIEGKVNRGAAVDPSVVQLEDGRIRMFFFGSEITEGDPAKSEGDHKIYSAISEDGIHFRAEPGVRFQMASITDPEVLRVGKEWFMFLSRGRETLLARSSDGLNFTVDSGFHLEIGGVPGAVMLSDASVRIFATGRGGIVSARFNPNSSSVPIIEKGARVSVEGAAIVADPACVKRLDGSYYLIFKKKPITPDTFRPTKVHLSD